jgi:uncharacterized protein DUF4402
MRARAALIVLAAALGPRGAGAQSSGGIGIDAEVIGNAMAITTVRDLAFGSVVKGVPTTVAPGAAGAGEWQVTGNKNAFAQITFTLPAQLINVQALPGSAMPISFGAGAALWRRDVNNPAGATTFDPGTGTTGRFGATATPTLYIWIGGTVNPAANAKPGVYVGTVVVSLVYL